ncbi:MAG: hypothetical protein V4579_09020 [Pseudomonadota bacterium]
MEVGIDPVAERRKAAGVPTFRQAAALVHAEHKAGWKNGKHREQWLSTLEIYEWTIRLEAGRWFSTDPLVFVTTDYSTKSLVVKFTWPVTSS